MIMMMQQILKSIACNERSLEKHTHTILTTIIFGLDKLAETSISRLQ